MKSRLNLLRDVVLTISGLEKRGFFIPFAHAASVPTDLQPYAGLERTFADAESAFMETLNKIDAVADDLSAACEGPIREHWNSGYFGPLDAAATFALVRASRTERIVEVGSGSSTHVMAAAAKDMDPKPIIQCIDPIPRSSISDLGVTWEEAVLKDGNIHLFETLAAGDIAFFDSSHVLFEGTDVDIIQNRIMPILKPGVLVHIHDIFLPDPYPRSWARRAYTEHQGLGGWIAGGAYELVFSSHYAATRMQDVTSETLNNAVPSEVSPGGGSLWMRRI